MQGYLKTPGETRAFGVGLAKLLQAGDVILLSGKLGAGKTLLVQGIAEGLGVEEQVTSPTFVLVSEYAGRIPLRHADFYRLDNVGEILALGIDELFDEESVTVIEWGEALGDNVRGPYLHMELDYSADGESRSIRISGSGSAWENRIRRIRSLLADRVNTQVD